MQRLLRQMRMHPNDLDAGCPDMPPCLQSFSCNVASSLGVANAASGRCRLPQCGFRGRRVSQHAVMASLSALRAVCGWAPCSGPLQSLLAGLPG